MSYNIRRLHANTEHNHTVRTGLTLEEAVEHCRDPETSSGTCTSPELIAYTERVGPWFDGFDEKA